MNWLVIMQKTGTVNMVILAGNWEGGFRKIVDKIFHMGVIFKTILIFFP